MVLQLQMNTSFPTWNTPNNTQCDPTYRFRCYRCHALICLHHVCTPDVLTELRFVALWPRCLDTTTPVALEQDMLCRRCFELLYPETTLIAGLGQHETQPGQCEVYL